MPTSRLDTIAEEIRFIARRLRQIEMELAKAAVQHRFAAWLFSTQMVQAYRKRSVRHGALDRHRVGRMAIGIVDPDRCRRGDGIAADDNCLDHVIRRLAVDIRFCDRLVEIDPNVVVDDGVVLDHQQVADAGLMV